MEHIKDTLTGLLRSIEEKQKTAQEDNPYNSLKKILTKKEIKHIKFNYFKKGVLSLHVDNSSWLFQFNIKKEGILEKLKKDFPRVKEIRFYLGEFK